MKHSFVRYVLGLIVLLTLAACGTAAVPTAQTVTTPLPSSEPTTQPAATPEPTPQAQASDKPKIAGNAPILTIQTNGGHCLAGTCGSEKQIRADGSYRATDGTGAKKDGKFSDAQIAELTQLIAAADFAEISNQPFTGTCPIAFDGQEFVYTFQTMSGPVTLASCQVAIDENSPLFKHIGSLIDEMNQP